MKKILILGGTLMQLPIIKYAKSQGHHVITVDYLPNNVGHKYSDEYYNISTIDKESVLELALHLKIDGILAYASDPAAATAAYVSEKLNLPGNNYSTIKMMSNKTLFRNFLSENHFSTPENRSFKQFDDFAKYVTRFEYPLIVKPVDSSGSKGISKIYKSDCNLSKIFEKAIEFSPTKEIIVEKIIEGKQLHGDAFVANGKLIFSFLGDQNFDDSQGQIVPCYTLWPSEEGSEIITNIEDQIQKFINLSGFSNGGLNIEVRIDKETHSPYIIEIGPRNGGHFTPDTIFHATGFDFAKNSVNSALGEELLLDHYKISGFYANLILHTNRSGVFNNISFNNELSDHIIEYHIYKNTGERIEPYSGSNTAIGVAIVRFDDYQDAVDVLNKAYLYYTIH